MNTPSLLNRREFTKTALAAGAAVAAAGAMASPMSMSAFLPILRAYPLPAETALRERLPYEILTAGSGTQSRVRKSQKASPAWLP